MSYTRRYKSTPQMVDSTRAVVQCCPYIPGIGDGPPLWTGDYVVMNHPEKEGELSLRIQMPSMWRLEPNAPFSPIPSSEAAKVASGIVSTAVTDYPHIQLVTDVVVVASSITFEYQAHAEDVLHQIKKYIPTMRTIDIKGNHI